MKFTSVTVRDLTVDADPILGDHAWLKINGYDEVGCESIDKDEAKEIVDLLIERFGLWSCLVRTLP